MSTQIQQSDALLRNIEFSRRFQTFGAWCGPAFVLLLFGGWGVLGGFIPLIPPSSAPGQVAAAYSTTPVVHLIGLTLAMIGTAATMPFFLTLSMQMRRAELRTPFLAIMQLISGIVVTVILLIPILFFVVAQFRPERSPELTQLLDDLSYICLILPWPPIFGQLIPLALAIFNDHRERPVFPRWLAYLNLWTAVFLLPASLLIFFKTGPFAWNGLFGFWIPAAVFGLWYLIMCWVLLRAIKDEAREERALAHTG
jgi:hypothetical protein